MEDDFELEYGKKTIERLERINETHIVNLFKKAWERVIEPKKFGDWLTFHVDFKNRGAKLVYISIEIKGFGTHKRIKLTQILRVGPSAEYKAFLILQQMFSRFKDELVQLLSTGHLCLAPGIGFNRQEGVVEKSKGNPNETNHRYP